MGISGAFKGVDRTAVFQSRLLAWFRSEGRDYPWRRTRDPYAILVSEMMLQQTQIATVLGRGYYQRWMEAFPDVVSLAAAPEPEVLRVWEGLGYYSRARNLHKTAQAVLTEHGGVFPRSVEGLLTLPGIGRYTAGAVASFAWNLPAALVDGNVARVLTRLLACDEEIDRPAVQQKLNDWAAALLNRDEPRLHNSAIMELGQRICTPRAPACLICPVRSVCASAGPDAVKRPRKRAARETVLVTEHALFALRKGKLLLHQESGRRRQGLWKLPERSTDEVHGLPEILTAPYTITHHRVTLHVYESREAIAGPGETWHPLAEVEALPMPGPYRKALNRIMENRLL
ncbi:MAG: dna glycosylase [Verrucomicrobiales bacterium]|nr:dna glycosylase [Verrucomicrobiales bacterium]